MLQLFWKYWSLNVYWSFDFVIDTNRTSGTNRFPIYDFLYAVNSNLLYRTHRFATIQTRDRQIDGRCSLFSMVG